MDRGWRPVRCADHHGSGRLASTGTSACRATSFAGSKKAQLCSAADLAVRPASRAGYFVRPTVFTRVNNAMTIAREEIFGPVLAIIPYHSDQEAIDTANDTDYGLSSYVWSSELGTRAKRRPAHPGRNGSTSTGLGSISTPPLAGTRKVRQWPGMGRLRKPGLPGDQGDHVRANA